MSHLTTAAELAADLEARILSGDLTSGERLEPVRDAAARLDLAPNTVASAYRTLSDRGLLIGRGRSGTFVADRRPTFSAEPVIPDGVVDLASGNPDPALIPDLGDVLSGLEVPRTLYGDVPVLPEFEQAVKAHLVDLNGEFAVVNGALDGVERVLAAHLRPGDKVGVENPGWPALTDLLRAMLLRPVAIEVDSEGLVSASLESVVGGLDAVVITSRVQNPTGACTSQERAAELMRIIDRNPRLLVVEDDHAGAISGSDLVSVGEGRQRWALVVSMSKAIGPDLRVAGLLGDVETISLVQGRQGVGPGWVSHLTQRLAAALIHRGTEAGAFAQAAEIYAQRRNGFVKALEAHGVSADARSGLNVWVEHSQPAAVLAACLDAGYAVRSGDGFVIGDRRGVRVTTALIDSETSEAVAALIGSVGQSGRRHIRSG